MWGRILLSPRFNPSTTLVGEIQPQISHMTLGLAPRAASEALLDMLSLSEGQLEEINKSFARWQYWNHPYKWPLDCLCVKK